MITVKDISALLKHKPHEDASVEAFIKQNEMFQVEHKLKRINSGIQVIKEHWPKAKATEIFVAFDMSNCCVDDLIENMETPGFREQVKDELKRRLTLGSSTPQPRATISSDTSSTDGSDDLTVIEEPEESSEPEVRVRRRRKKPKKDLDEDGSMNLMTHTCSSTLRKRWSKNCPIDPSKIPPAPPEIKWSEWITWSSIRRQAYLNREKDMNAYLYRFPPPGVQQKNGPWEEKEKSAFLKKLQEVRGDSDTMTEKWGIFSQAIPGRVGYQCSNFYRQLIEAGEVYDSCYVRDETGRLRHTSYLRGRKSKTGKGAVRRRTASKQDCNVQLTVSTEPSVAPLKDNEKKETKVLSRYEQWALQNPRPDWKDSLTGDPMKVPTLAPDGYVLDYQTWSMTMNGSECVNPFTREKYHKRDMVVLTMANYEEYKDKIKYVDMGSDE